MERHHEKRRDMARSILPSKNREAARTALSKTRRAHRHAISQELRALVAPARVVRRADGEVIERWDDEHDLRRTADVEIRRHVWWRRAGDKVNPFIRWAIATTADLPIEDRLPALRAMLPTGLIGDHAMTHLEDQDELRPAREGDWRPWHESWASRLAAKKAERAAAYRDLRTILREAVEAPGGLRELNATMKVCDRHVNRRTCDQFGCYRRCLAGIHDVDAFLRDVSPHPELDPFDPDAPIPHRCWRVDAPAALAHRRFCAYLAALEAACTTSPRGLHRGLT